MSKYFFTKIGFDTSKNEHSEVWYKGPAPKNCTKPGFLLHSPEEGRRRGEAREGRLGGPRAEVGEAEEVAEAEEGGPGRRRR